MSWQKLEDMPCVVTAIQKAEREIKESTGVEIKLAIEYLQLSDDEIKPVLQDVVSTYFNTTWVKMLMKNRSGSLIKARHTYMYLAHKVFGFTSTEVGEDCRRDPGTVLSACKKIQGYYEVDDKMIKDIEAIKNLLSRKLTK